MFRAVDWDLCGVRYVRLQAGVLLFKLCAFFNVQPPSESEFNLHIILPPLPHPYQRIPYFPPRSGTNARGVFVFSALCGYFRLGWAFSFRFCMRYVCFNTGSRSGCFLAILCEVSLFLCHIAVIFHFMLSYTAGFSTRAFPCNLAGRIPYSFLHSHPNGRRVPCRCIIRRERGCFLFMIMFAPLSRSFCLPCEVCCFLLGSCISILMLSR